MSGRTAWWCVAILGCLACEPALPPPVLDIPPTPSDATPGSEVARDLRTLGLDAREERIFAEIGRGNVPSWLRELRRVQVSGNVDGRDHQVTFWVTPDYLSVGSDEDYVLVPLSPQVAQRVADLLGASLPTPRMVDAIWSAARVRLAPQRIQPDDSIESVRTVQHFERHHNVIRGQRQLRGVAPDAFVAGHKKDVVLSTALQDFPGRVAIYGWHRRDGRPNQPLSTVPEDSLVYYSHGVRLVHRRIVVDGTARDLDQALRDPALAPLLSDEGVILNTSYPVTRTTGTSSGNEGGDGDVPTPPP